MNIYRDENSIDKEKYVIATYEVATRNKDIAWVAWQIAIGQSVGNPNVRNHWETDELFENHSSLILGNEEELKGFFDGYIKIAFPIVNTNWKEDGITQLMVQLMGGQMDIDGIDFCRLANIEFPQAVTCYFKGPKYGLEGIRAYTGVYDKPLFGGIIKPKIGVSPQVLAEMVKEMVEGGVNFIKEDEIMSNPACCPLEERLKIINPIIKGTNVIYCYCINSDFPYVVDRARRVAELGGNGIHVNFWNGLGVYKTLRDLNLPLFIHFQKSGDKVLTDPRNPYSISWDVMCDLAGYMGVDFIHAGMWGGYKSDNEEELKRNMSILHKHGVMPALSCGMHPGLVQAIVKRFGNNFMANTGGAIHGHSGGSLAGAKAMRQAIDKTGGPEYDAAIKQWGLVE